MPTGLWLGMRAFYRDWLADVPCAVVAQVVEQLFKQISSLCVCVRGDVADDVSCGIGRRVTSLSLITKFFSRHLIVGFIVGQQCNKVVNHTTARSNDSLPPTLPRPLANKRTSKYLEGDIAFPCLTCNITL